MNGRDCSRRLFLLQGVLLGVALGQGGCAPLPIRQGVRRIEGEARLDGGPLGVDGLVRPGDTVTTGPKGRMVLVMGEDAFLLGENTVLSFHAETLATPTPTPEPESRSTPQKPAQADPMSRTTGFTLRSGRALSVFGAGSRTLITPTATIGIRGTGLFLHVAPEQDYLCLCYGRVDIRMHASPRVAETLEARHHSARYLSPDASIRKGPMINHTDEELFMLEALVNRRPPFAEDGKTGY
ncbi:MAG: hypothetical protein HQL98_00825 [Magnetococcales bacterium]|nr:hypothetical protein [Magnetococcales bacterium]